MKQFNTFGEYMFALLFGPLKKGKRSVNQFFIFFTVIGHIFDGMKEDIFRVRNEANVATSSPVMLPIHGQDRNMPRLRDEEDEAYRNRLSMKGIVAEKAGTVTGLLICLKSLELEGEIIPFYTIDAERWAEFLVRIRCALDSPRMVNMGVVRSQIQAVKQASSKDNYELNFYKKYNIKIRYENTLFLLATIYPRNNIAYHFLEGVHFLDGNKILNGYAVDKLLDFYPLDTKIGGDVLQEITMWPRLKLYSKADTHQKAFLPCLKFITDVQNGIDSTSRIVFPCECQVFTSVEVTLTVEDNLRHLDGKGYLNGQNILNADIYYYQL